MSDPKDEALKAIDALIEFGAALSNVINDRAPTRYEVAREAYNAGFEAGRRSK